MMELEPDKNLIDGNMKERDFSKRGFKRFFQELFQPFFYSLPFFLSRLICPSGNICSWGERNLTKQLLWVHIHLLFLNLSHDLNNLKDTFLLTKAAIRSMSQTNIPGLMKLSLSYWNSTHSRIFCRWLNRGVLKLNRSGWLSIGPPQKQVKKVLFVWLKKILWVQTIYLTKVAYASLHLLLPTISTAQPSSLLLECDNLRKPSHDGPIDFLPNYAQLLIKGTIDANYGLKQVTSWLLLIFSWW